MANYWLSLLDSIEATTPTTTPIALTSIDSLAGGVLEGSIEECLALLCSAALVRPDNIDILIQEAIEHVVSWFGDVCTDNETTCNLPSLLGEIDAEQSAGMAFS
jgi:hypothetical protein